MSWFFSPLRPRVVTREERAHIRMIIQREDQRSAARIARIDEQNRRENQRREIEELLLEVLRRMASSDKIPCANDSVLNFRGSGSGSFAQGDATTGTSEASTSEINPVDDPRSSRHFPEHPEIEQTLDATGGAPPSYSDSSARGELLDALQPEVLALFLDKKNVTFADSDKAGDVNDRGGVGRGTRKSQNYISTNPFHPFSKRKTVCLIAASHGEANQPLE
ncbi:hypothetical protein D9756_008679 [Leucocoprinus leucothites]|uniref:Uncharacterized protein n=1 Tax=Leucocoprinus leucothites TaxID=201217 RepID=A0A8H5FUU4_9AGAR|nr:hypothetical protein D9756_008679 [Leucoagaricus leucothites]